VRWSVIFGVTTPLITRFSVTYFNSEYRWRQSVAAIAVLETKMNQQVPTWTGFQRPRRLICDLETLTEHYGKFYAQPFERGFGTTVGNTLRRALLSSIAGAALTAVKVDGALDESAAIPNVKEDCTDLILNLKLIPFKLKGEASKTLTIEVVGPAEVTAANIVADEEVEILDKGVYLATVEAGGTLKVEMCLKQNYGYITAAENLADGLTGGYIPLDSAHSPVRKVNYQVEPARLGQDTDYDKLTLEVWTNGSVRPDIAINLAAKLIKEHMTAFINFEEGPEVQEPEPENRPTLFNEHLDRSVEELELSVRSYNCLKNADIRTIRELVQKSEAEMLKTKNFGRKSLNEIKEILGAMGLYLGMRFDLEGNPIKEL
jgi:DNA-directed RNA polymerase subunit alpha